MRVDEVYRMRTVLPRNSSQEEILGWKDAGIYVCAHSKQLIMLLALGLVCERHAIHSSSGESEVGDVSLPPELFTIEVNPNSGPVGVGS